MKLLWIKTDFLHPANHGGRIRSLELLKRLHRRHEVHYLAFSSPDEPEGARRANEYSTRSHAIRRNASRQYSLPFWRDFAAAAVSGFPFSAYRYRSNEMRSAVGRLIETGGFDRVVCDFPYPAINIDRLEECALFQHNVETIIWRRQAAFATDPARRAFFHSQAVLTERLERNVCRRVERVLAVSQNDARAMTRMFGIPTPGAIPTGVDSAYYHAQPCEARWDLVFVGAMDWLPNVDAVRFFLHEILPRIRRERPGARFAIVGRKPSEAVLALARMHANVTVAGDVPDVRPYLWASKLCVVPLRMGGGTRLKIYEAMAAERAVVSTQIGAEGLTAHPPHDIRLADRPEDFAFQCSELLGDDEMRQAVAREGANLVRTSFSWDRSAAAFEEALGIEP